MTDVTENTTTDVADLPVFVATYGSLRVGQSNYRTNERAGATLFGSGWTKENYDLYRYHSSYFPSISLKHSENKKQVRVDVFKTDIKGLRGPYDGLEGYPNFYNRTIVPIILDSGEEINAYIYHIDEQMEDSVVDGDWVEYLKKLREDRGL